MTTLIIKKYGPGGTVKNTKKKLEGKNKAKTKRSNSKGVTNAGNTSRKVPKDVSARGLGTQMTGGTQSKNGKVKIEDNNLYYEKLSNGNYNIKEGQAENNPTKYKIEKTPDGDYLVFHTFTDTLADPLNFQNFANQQGITLKQYQPITLKDGSTSKNIYKIGNNYFEFTNDKFVDSSFKELNGKLYNSEQTKPNLVYDPNGNSIKLNSEEVEDFYNKILNQKPNPKIVKAKKLYNDLKAQNKIGNTVNPRKLWQYRDLLKTLKDENLQDYPVKRMPSKWGYLPTVLSLPGTFGLIGAMVNSGLFGGTETSTVTETEIPSTENSNQEQAAKKQTAQDSIQNVEIGEKDTTGFHNVIQEILNESNN